VRCRVCGRLYRRKAVPARATEIIVVVRRAEIIIVASGIGKWDVPIEVMVYCGVVAHLARTFKVGV
jgi:hypothetical protein